MTTSNLADHDRRGFLRSVALAAGGLTLSPLTQPLAHGDAPTPKRPKRVVVFLQNQGLHPVSCRPSSVKIYSGHGSNFPDYVYQARDDVNNIDRVLDVPLVGKELPEHFAPLVPYAERMTILQGVNGTHVRPFHGAGFAALAGVGQSKQSAAAQTIDCALAQALPATLPFVGLGWGSLAHMQRTPIVYCSSAWDRNRPAPLYNNPLIAHRELFGAGAIGTALERFQHDTEVLDVVRSDVQRLGKSLPEAELAPLRPLLDGYEVLQRRRQQLADMADTLRKHAPELTEKFTAPKTDLDWKEASFEVGCAALLSGLTNVLTIASGNCGTDQEHGPFTSLGIKLFGHEFGHTGPANMDWIRVHNFNTKLLVSLINRLEAVKEGAGTMMDNTVIVYTSCHAEAQHSTGSQWPFILIGTLGGTLRTGRFLHYPVHARHQGRRTINALYATLLHAVGVPRDRFNLEGALRGLDTPGPLEAILA